MSGSVLSPITTAATTQPIEYPTTDGEPMAETDWQAIPLMYAVTGLRDYFRQREDVYVSGNLLIYYEEGNMDASVAPDVFVVVGVPNHTRPTYRLWQETKAPDFVLEITSRSTRVKDGTEKRDLYERLGVEEYWRYDPTGDYLDPPLSGLQLRSGEYVELAAKWMEDGTLAMYSRVLGLELRIVEEELRFHDREADENVLTLTESNEARRQAEAARWQAEAARRQAEVACRQAEVARHREARQRRAAEARVAELEALLKQRR